MLSSTKCKKVSDIKETALVKPQIQKNVMASLIENLDGLLDFTQNALKSVSTKMEEHESELIIEQKSVNKLKKELISERSDQLEAVQSTVKTEMRAISDIVKEGNKNQLRKKLFIEQLSQHSPKISATETL